MVHLSDLGNRICIIGPSSTGKSTLAKALGEKLHVKVCHLDQLAHVPETNWEIRDEILFKQDHDLFLQENSSWIIDGNYSFLMQKRLACATAVIWLDFNRLGSLYRYVLRSMKDPKSRAGNLVGASRQFNWALIVHMIRVAPRNRSKYLKFILESNIHHLYLHSFRQLKDYYRFWQLNS